MTEQLKRERSATTAEKGKDRHNYSNTNNCNDRCSIINYSTQKNKYKITITITNAMLTIKIPGTYQPPQ